MQAISLILAAVAPECRLAGELVDMLLSISCGLAHSSSRLQAVERTLSNEQLAERTRG